MNAHADLSGADPRRALSAEDLKSAGLNGLPQVARTPRTGDGLGLLGGVLAALALGAATFAMLSRDRAAPPPAAPATTEADGVRAKPAQPAAPAAAATAASTPAVAAPPPGTMVDPNQSRAGPMIIDNSGGPEAPASGPEPAGATAGQPAAASLSADEQFALRVGGEAGPARAVGLGDPAHTIMQGAIIPAVLETALNSDLPGYARAIVSRDVRGFDGSEVLVPRGSRLIGRYKSGLATGQTRAFIVWTRLIRPDGVSIDLGSPVMDEAGAAGVAGKVDRHFVQRFGAAMMLSVVSGAASAMGDGSSSTLVIGSGSEASSVAAQALQSDGKIPPTIRIPQGAPIQVFVARDLDFSGR